MVPENLERSSSEPPESESSPSSGDHRTRLTADNCQQIISLYDLVVDGSDNFTTRYLVNDACFLPHRQYVWGSVFQFQGQGAQPAPKTTLLESHLHLPIETLQGSRVKPEIEGRVA